MKKKFMGLMFILTLVFIVYTPISLIGQDFNNFEEAGTYPVTIKDEYGQDSKVIYVTVLFPRSQVDKTYREGIDAHDISIEKGLFKTLTDLEIIKLTNAHAWDLDNGSTIPIVSVIRETVEEANGRYKVTFQTAKGTSMTINVLESEMKQVATNQTKFIDQEFYVNFFEFISTYEMVFLLLLFILVPIIVLCILYWLTTRRVKKVEELLYNKNV